MVLRWCQGHGQSCHIACASPLVALKATYDSGSLCCKGSVSGTVAAYFMLIICAGLTRHIWNTSIKLRMQLMAITSDVSAHHTTTTTPPDLQLVQENLGRCNIAYVLLQCIHLPAMHSAPTEPQTADSNRCELCDKTLHKYGHVHTSGHAMECDTSQSHRCAATSCSLQ